MELVREKYTRRGWKMIRAVTAAQALRSDLNMFDRHVSDRWCWSVPLLPIPPEVFVQGNMRLGRPEMVFMHSWKLDYDPTWTDAVMVRRGFWIPRRLEQKYCFSEETLAEVREFIRLDAEEDISESRFHRVITRLYAERAREDHPENMLRLLLLDIFRAADAKYRELSFIHRHKAYSAQLLAEVFRPLLAILGNKLQYRCIFLQTETDNMWMRITLRVPVALRRTRHTNLITIDPQADVLKQLSYQRVDIKFVWVTQAGSVPDEESRLLPNDLTREDLASSVVITVEDAAQEGKQGKEDMKERMRERFSGIVRAKEGKMVNVSSYVPFDLQSGSRPSSASRSMSRSRNPHANVISPVSAVLPAQSDVIVQADAGGRSSSQVPPLRHGQADLTYPSSNFHSNHPPPTVRTNSNSDMSAILAARRPSLAPSESDGCVSPSLRAPGLNARLVGVAGLNAGARRGRPMTKLGGYGGSSSSLSLGGSSRDGEGGHDPPPARLPLPLKFPSSPPVNSMHPRPPQSSPTDTSAPPTPLPHAHRRNSPSAGQLPNFAIRNPGNITIGWDDE
ncbi:hypothetical protein PQX77_014098 [Marasmius sp. AFHP31]|nr:hypothetical protein PQX77_014098 [Marasmius sp. AFHP31]